MTRWLLTIGVCCLLLLTPALAGSKWSRGRVSWYGGRSGHVAARRRVVRKGDRIGIARPDGTRARRFKRSPDRATNHLHDFRSYVIDAYRERCIACGVDPLQGPVVAPRSDV